MNEDFSGSLVTASDFPGDAIWEYSQLTQDEKYKHYKRWCAERGFEGDEPYEYFK